MKKMNKAFAFLAGAALAFGGLFIGCSEDNGALTIDDKDPTKIISDATSTATDAAKQGETKEDSGDPDTTDKGSSVYTLDITKIPETTGATNKLDDTITVVSTKKNSSGTAQTIKYSSSGYVQMSGAGVGTDYALQLTLTGKATIKVKATKKSKGTAAAVKILDSAGKEAGKTTGIDENGATTLTEYSISNVAAGTYYLGADSNGCLLFSLVIEYQ